MMIFGDLLDGAHWAGPHMFAGSGWPGGQRNKFLIEMYIKPISDLVLRTIRNLICQVLDV